MTSALLQPIAVGAVALPNRLVMGSMHTGLEGHPERFDELARFYAERAKGGVGLIVTGGFAPNHAGRMQNEPGTLEREDQVPAHRKVTAAVHAAGGRILLQILHAGRYGYHPDIVAPSALKSPINRDTPAMLSHEQILATIADYANTATLARQAGYDGVEVMGSEGYLITQFLARRTNHRDDEWGGALERRARFPLAVVAAVREALGAEGILCYRISALDLVEGGLDEGEIAWLAQRVERAGADCLSTGIGWHEAPVPTIAGSVPHAAFADATARLKQAVSIPVTASNRINLPEIAERLVAEGMADLVSMARPFLADPAIAEKLGRGRGDLVNICIACNQACLDHIFDNIHASCLVNPVAGRETTLRIHPTRQRRKVAVVGAGPGGLASACTAAERGHEVVLFEASDEIGGQFNFAKLIPGKEEFHETVRYFRRRLVQVGVEVRLGQRVSAEDLRDFDVVLVATGVTPRELNLPGVDHPSVVSYVDVLSGAVEVGERVAVIGAGGIGHDVATFLAEPRPSQAEDPARFAAAWGIAAEAWGQGEAPAGGLVDKAHHPPLRQITICQRSKGKMGSGLGKTTGWIHRKELDHLGVVKLTGVTYERIDDAGLHVTVDGAPRVIEADHVVVCAGQLPLDELSAPLQALGIEVHKLGGAAEARELDARRAIEQGTRIAAAI